MVTKIKKRELQGIAIVGMAGRFPGAASVSEFWSNLCGGIESITFSTDEELITAGVSPESFNTADYVRAGGNIQNADSFDAEFFGFNAREAEILDPQHRVFLQCCWDCFEDAAYDPHRIAGPVGVFAGAGMNTYGIANLFGNEALMSGTGGYQLMVGNDKDFLATRVAYKLNLKGPAISVQTACSTSLVAVQMAFESLQRGECDMALAGGVSIFFPQGAGYQYVPGMILSPDGHCRAFDAKAAGTVPGRGAGAVLLKRLDEAIEDRDHIYAVIRGAAINNDGSAKVGYSAPSVEGQRAVIAQSIQMAGFEPSTLRYIEAHGTGTEIGDPVEIKALIDAFGETDRKQFCALGSVKTNIGHLDTAAGITGLIKAALTVRHRTIPPTLHYQTANPLIPFDRSPFYVPTSLLPFTENEPFRAGVSSFGIGGTNAHVSLEEYKQPQNSSDKRPQLFILSARSDEALAARCKTLAAHLARNPSISLADVAWTLQDGRHAFRHRKTFLATSTTDARNILEDFNSARTRGGITESRRKEILFLFPGQGSQYANMGRGLYESAPIFRNAVDTCSEILQPILGLDLRTVLYPPPGEESSADSKLAETWLTQPALFVTEYAMARLCMSCGIQPTAMLGHSVGEFVAAHLANVFSLRDALHLIALRGRLIYSLPAGAMLAVPLSEAEVAPLLPAGASVAAVNAPSQTVVSGTQEAISVIEQACAARGLETRRLRTSHAFHSSMLDSIIEPFREQVSRIERNPPTIPILSNLSGTWLTREEAISADYWADHLRHAVRFADCAAVVTQHPDWVVVETGPGETLLSLLRQANISPSAQILIPTIRQPRASHDDYEIWLNALGRMWIAGIEIDWSGLHSPNLPRRLPLPGYPFELQRYWIDPVERTRPNLSTAKRSLEKQVDIANWFYTPTWRKSSPFAPEPASPLSEAGVYLVIQNAEQDFSLVNEALGDFDQSIPVVLVTLANTFEHLSHNHFKLSPHLREHWDRLLSTLTARGQWPERILHMLNLQLPQEPTLTVALDRGFFSLMALTQAVGNISSTRNIWLNIVTSQSFSIAGEPVSNPIGASLSGFAKVLSIESPNIRWNVVDIDNWKHDSTLNALLREVLATPENNVIALRRGTRWTQTFDATPMSSPSSSDRRPSQSDTYLITGGLGGLGLVFAEELARSNGGGHFVLISRTSAPDEELWESIANDSAQPASTVQRVRGLLKIRAAGGTITTLQADVSDKDRMKEIATWCHQKFLGIRGVIHAAGIPSHSMVITKTREEAMTVFQSKLLGTPWLEELLEFSKPDFILLCSSISAVAPVAGLSDYATANAYLDAFAAKYDNTQGTRVISVNWDTWSDVGMAAEIAHQRGLSDINAAGITHAISSKEGAAVLGRLLSFPSSQVVVSTRDLLLLLEQAQKTAQSEIRLPEAIASGKLHPRPALLQSYVEPTDEMETAVAMIWSELLGIDKVGRFDNFFELGGHSLLGTQVMARIRQQFGLDLPLRTVFEASTPAEMAGFLRAIPWASGVKNDSPVLEGEREEIEL